MFVFLIRLPNNSNLPFSLAGTSVYYCYYYKLKVELPSCHWYVFYLNTISRGQLTISIFKIFHYKSYLNRLRGTTSPWWIICYIGSRVGRFWLCYWLCSLKLPNSSEIFFNLDEWNEWAEGQSSPNPIQVILVNIRHTNPLLSYPFPHCITAARVPGWLCASQLECELHLWGEGSYHNCLFILRT